MGGGVEIGLSLCGLGRAARLVLTFLLRCPPGVAPGAPHERLADVERGLGYAPAQVVAVLFDGVPVGVVGRRARALEVALERPAVGHLLPPSDARLLHPRWRGRRLQPKSMRLDVFDSDTALSQ